MKDPCCEFTFPRKCVLSLLNHGRILLWLVKLLGRPMGYKFLCNRLESLWTITKGFKVIDLENGFFLDRFRSEDDVDCALTQGPWTVLGHYFIIQQWTLYLDSTSEKIDSMVAWIRLPSMPLHYYKKKKSIQNGGPIGGKSYSYLL